MVLIFFSGIRFKQTQRLQGRLHALHVRIHCSKDPLKLEKIFYLNVYPGEYEEAVIKYDVPFEADVSKKAEDLRLDERLEAWRRQAATLRREAATLARSNGALTRELSESRWTINSLQAEIWELRVENERERSRCAALFSRIPYSPQ